MTLIYIYHYIIYMVVVWPFNAVCMHCVISDTKYFTFVSGNMCIASKALCMMLQLKAKVGIMIFISKWFTQYNKIYLLLYLIVPFIPMTNDRLGTMTSWKSASFRLKKYRSGTHILSAWLWSKVISVSEGSRASWDGDTASLGSVQYWRINMSTL